MESSANEEQPLNFSKSATNSEDTPGTSVPEKCNFKPATSLNGLVELTKSPLLKHHIPSALLMPSGLLPPNYINGSFVAAAAVSAAMNAAASCRQLSNSISSSVSPTTDANSVALLSRTSTLLSNRCPTSSPTLLCAVCGDISSGKHYGILACNGCSGFFKRSVRRRLIYRCQAGTGSCIVDKTHRNQCQACRLRKCLSKGMNKDAVQNERQPRSTATVRITDDASTSSSSSDSPFSTGFLTKNILSNSASSMFKNNVAEQVYCMERSSTSEDFSGAESVYEIATKVLFIAVKWVKTFSALASLPLSDQLLCLEDAWNDLFVLSIMQWSVSMENDSFVLTATLFPGKEQIQCLEDVFFRIKALSITQDEFVYLKTLLLLNSGIRGLKKPLQVQELQDRTQRMLQKSSSSLNSTRFGRLLLILPQLRVISKEKLEETLFRPVFGSTSVVKIIYAMYRGKQSQ